MLKQIKEWLEFSGVMYNHIVDYTTQQYGDRGRDPVTKWSVEECLQQIEKYVKRHGSNVRPGSEQLDLLKIAHYAQIAWTKIQESNNV